LIKINKKLGFVSNVSKHQKIAQFAKTQAKKTVQFKNYATAEKVDLSDDIKRVLKPEVLKTIEGKTDFALIKKLNFLGTVAAVRLNCASQLQLQALNGKSVFKIVCYELPDPWDYYWHQVCENGNDPEKWRASMQELKDVPILVERCFRTMCISGVYPDVNHYNLLIESCAKLGDVESAHMFHDDVNRCVTEKRDKKNQEAFRYMTDAWLNAKDWEVGQFVHAETVKRGVALSSDAEEKISKLKATYDPKAGFEYMSGKSQIKPNYIKEMEDAEAENTRRAIDMAIANIQPPLEKLISPEELLNRKTKAAEAAKAAKA
jgi:pentatricopeptide repeat protein